MKIVWCSGDVANKNIILKKHRVWSVGLSDYYFLLRIWKCVVRNLVLNLSMKCSNEDIGTLYVLNNFNLECFPNVHWFKSNDEKSYSTSAERTSEMILCSFIQSKDEIQGNKNWKFQETDRQLKMTIEVFWKESSRVNFNGRSFVIGKRIFSKLDACIAP